MTNPPADERAAASGDPELPDTGDESEFDVLTALRDELDQARAQYQRAVADYQNLQRRSQQDRLDYSRDALHSVVRNFLPVLDDLNRALDSVDAELVGHRWVDGIRLVRQKFWAVLEAAGVHEIPARGERFDPQLHEAVGHAPGEDGCVAQLIQAGYMIGDRMIRPAMVLVGNGEQPTDGQATGATRPNEITEGPGGADHARPDEPGQTSGPSRGGN
jgi:molecular chaperone GrpE